MHTEMDLVRALRDIAPMVMLVVGFCGTFYVMRRDSMLHHSGGANENKSKDFKANFFFGIVAIVILASSFIFMEVIAKTDTGWSPLQAVIYLLMAVGHGCTAIKA
jgi:hypothetical protein